MAGNNAAEITVAANGMIAVAPVGTVLPETLADPLATEFVEVGYVTEDGVTFTATPTIEDIPAWQSPDPVRRLVTARELTLAASFQQWNRDTFATAFGGGKWTATGGVYRYDPPASTDALAEQSLVITAIDGEKKMRWVVERTNVTEAVETNLVRTGAAVLPVTFSALTPDGKDRAWYFLADDTAFAPAVGGGAGPRVAPAAPQRFEPVTVGGGDSTDEE